MEVKVLYEYIEEIIADKVEFAPGCAGYDEAGTENVLVRLLNRSAKKWYGLDNNKEYIERYLSLGNLFYGDLNRHNWADQIPP